MNTSSTQTHSVHVCTYTLTCPTHTNTHARTYSKAHVHTQRTILSSVSSLFRFAVVMRAAARFRDHCAISVLAALSSGGPSV